MRRTSNVTRENEKCIHSCGKTQLKDHMGDSVIILKWILDKWDVNMCN
jgi:hypothetical protein